MLQTLDVCSISDFLSQVLSLTECL